MNWAVTLFSAVAGGLLGTVGMFAIGQACVKWYKITSFEGYSGYFVVGLALLGGIVGCVLSIVAARLGYAWIGTQWYSQLGSALAAVLLALALTYGYAYLGVDRVPELDGQPIMVRWEIRLPAEGTDKYAPTGDPSEWLDDQWQLQLVSVVNHQPRGSEQATFHRESVRYEDGQCILATSVPLFTSRGEFCVNLSLGARDDGFWPGLRYSSHPNSFQWSPWQRTNKGLKQPDDRSAVMFRFKLEKASSAEVH